MALQKQSFPINFLKGMDTKPDPNQLQFGEFADLQNVIFDKLGALKKRNGFKNKTSLPTAATTLTTYNNNLTAIGTTLQSYSEGSNTWINNGLIQPMRLTTLPVVRNSVNQSQADAVISPNGLVCTAYTESNGTTTSTKYVVADSTTGQNVVAQGTLNADTTYGLPKVFVLGGYFIIVYVSPASFNLKFIAINTSTLGVGTEQTITTSITPSTTQNFDGVVYNGNLYLAWNGASASGVKAAFINSALTVSSNIIVDASHAATLMSLTADSTNNVIWMTYYNSATSIGYSLTVSPVDLSSVLAATSIITATTVVNITSYNVSGVNTFFYEVTNSPNNFIRKNTITAAGSVGSSSIVIRSLGLASKAFSISGQLYFLATYASTYQPTYFIVSSSSTAASPIVVAQLANSNGGGLLTNGLPCALVSGTTVSIAYLIKDLVTPVNKNTNVPAFTQTAGIYTQTGVNLASFNFTTSGFSTAEIGDNLHLTGGFLWSYDGVKPVEQNFFLYPEGTTSPSQPTTGGSLTAQVYFYQIVYRWTDNHGNIFRSSPSIPFQVDIHTSGTSTNTINLTIPTLRVTYKIDNPVVIEVYRWSTAQQTYYLTGTTANPTINPKLNDTTIDTVSFADLNADLTILGNQVLYTTGGVLEDYSPPSFNAITLFDTRLWGIDAEDPNILLFSKTVIENTPVEFSPFQSIYVAPNISEKQSTGPMKCVFPMDDKIIIFKESTMYYINGTGPDITGANSQYSEPTFIASPVGCSNQNSIVLIPDGLMFQSQKGIWLLDRGLGARYIGAPMEKYNANTILSSVAIPNSNRIVFTLDNGISLAYDYFVGTWSTFTGINGISSTIYNGLHTYLSAPITVSPPTDIPYTTSAQVYQETPNLYLDGANPVQMAFTTGWISLAGLQGFKRAYWIIILGNYISPHTFSFGIAFDFNPAIIQQPIITPTNSAESWGDDAFWGQDNDPEMVTDDTWGGTSDVEQWQINFQRQTCQSFQLTFNEIYDPSKNIPAGAGLTLSSMNLIVGLKKGYPRNIAASNKVG